MKTIPCKVCGEDSSGGDLKGKTYYCVDFPEIHIGPYCNKCLPNIRICNKCHYPRTNITEIVYVGEGKYNCLECII